MHIQIFLATVLLGCAGAFAHADMPNSAADERPIQSFIQPPDEPIELLPAGTTNAISSEVHAYTPELSGLPDRSFRTLWLRLFPILKAPLGDPFPETKNVNVVDLQNDGGLNVFRLDNGQLLGNSKTLHFDFSKKTFALGTLNVPLMPIWIAPAVAANTTVNWDKGVKGKEVGLRLRDGFAIEQTLFGTDPNPKWSLINVIEVEKYLLSVVPSEVLSTWHPEMLAAQAIAARTYSYYQMALARQKARNWDMDPTTSFQSYRGVEFLKSGKYTAVETAKTTQATIATAGQVITYNGEVINAYFSGNSGGLTCTAGECFDQTDVPYLQQVADAPGVTAKSGGTWGTKANITAKTVTAALSSVGVKPKSTVVSLASLRKGPSGRTWQLRVNLKSGHLDLDETQTRKVMSTFGAIRSFLYKLGGVTKGKQSIVGHGYGHGVGLSQEGGQIFATKGWNAAKILVYFYPGTKIQVL